MSTTLSRLLKYPHAAVFDKSPTEELAFRLQHTGGSTWAIGDAVLTATRGGTDFTYDLKALTVGQLTLALMADGFTVLMISAAFYSRSALVLVEGRGDQFASNGDNVFAYTSILWALLGGYAVELRSAKLQIQEALRQMVITQAENEWLDLWGTLYATPRLINEPDAAFAQRIPREAFRLRCNARGIELAIRDATGFDVRIEEPWTNIFRLDESLLSGPDAFYDGEYVGYHLIRPLIRSSVDWPAVLAVIERNRAAGIAVLGPKLIWSTLVDASVSPFEVSFGGLARNEAFIPYSDRALLDYDAIEELPILNYPHRMRTEVRQQSYAEALPLEALGVFTYVVHGGYRQTYEVRYLDIVYASQYWNRTADRTWRTDDTWSSVGPYVLSAYSES